jgi:ribonuclease-3
MDIDPRRQRQLVTLIQKLGLPAQVPVNWRLLDRALIHPSVFQDQNYEQLEFVGDAVVRLVAAQLLLESYPEAPVGEFAAIRSILVSDRTLAEIADDFGLERYLLMAPHVAKDPAGRISRLADAFEAVLGALYLSTQTLQLVRPWLDEPLHKKAIAIRLDPARFNYKEVLQEWTQAHYKQLPEYRVQEIYKAPSLQERFTAEVWLQDRQLGHGQGQSKKAAEQAAAKVAYLAILDADRLLGTT